MPRHRTQARVAVSAPVVRVAHFARRVGFVAVVVGLCWRPTHRETMTAGSADGVDVLFVVDSSSSMADEQAQLAKNFDVFFDHAFAGAGVDDGAQGARGGAGEDFRVAVTTTDADGRLSPVLDAQTPLLKQAFADAVAVGTGGDTNERGGDAIRAVLHADDGGFLRKDAALAVVVVSDEEDSSEASHAQIVATLRQAKAPGVPVMVAGVLGESAWDNGRYAQLVSAFHGQRLDINGDWGSQLGVIGAQTFALSRTLWLSHVAAAGTVDVTVDDFAVGFRATGDRVVLDVPVAPGSRVDVRYTDRWPLGVTLVRALPNLIWTGHVQLGSWIAAR